MARKPYYVDGMTAEQIASLPHTVINSLDSRELSHALAKINNVASKRATRLQERYNKYGDVVLPVQVKQATPFKTPKDLNAMRKQFKKTSEFLEGKTSTIKGSKKVYTERKAKILGMSVEEYEKLERRELNKRKKEEFEKALEEKKKKSKAKNKKRIKLTEKQKKKVEENVIKQYNEQVNVKINEIIEIYTKLKEIDKYAELNYGSPKIFEVINDVMNDRGNKSLMEIINTTLNKLQKWYDEEKLEEEEEEKRLRELYDEESFSIF